jgi:PAS domain S-box-containing protein
VTFTALNITERKQAEMALKESEERFRTLMENIDAVAVQGYGPDGTTQYWNKASERLYGYSRQEAIGRNLLDLIIPSEMKGAVVEEMQEMAESGQPIPSGELLLMHKDGSRIPVISHHAIVRVPGREQELFCLDVDITERKKAEEERENLRKQLNQAQKMESVGRLAGGIAHDYNNMLGVILGHTELALFQADESHDLHSDLKEIQAAAQRSADITKQLLAFARKQTISPKKLDLNNTVESMLNMLRRLIGEDIDLVWKPSAHLWPVKMDPSQIDQILANLCINAKDAIAGVGKLTIETGKQTFDEEYCNENPGFIPGDFVMLAVSDNGCGMDKDTLDNLFEPFFTTKEAGKGTGLGLATVYGIVKQNKGFINVYSEPGQGSTFKIYLSRFFADEGTDKKSMPEKNEAAGGTETILLVEDEPSILQMTRIMLERKGYSILSAATPSEAINTANAHIGKIHLLMTDVVMPEMNGRDLSEIISETYPDIKLLFMSGYTANVIAHQGVLDDGVAFMQKPFSMGDLTEKVREVLDTSPDKTQR